MITLRFAECSRYDLFTDSDVIQFLGITNRGTYHSEIPAEQAKAGRKAFKEMVLDLIDSDTPPCKVELEDVIKTTRGEYLG